jgi:hypothetical protein
VTVSAADVIPAPVLRRWPWWVAPLAGAAMAVLVGVTGYAGAPVLAAAVLVVDAVLLWGWALLLDLPAPRSTTAALGLAALLTVASVAFMQDEPYLEWLPVAGAGSVLVCFAHQLLRRDGRPRLVESLGGEITAVALLVCAAATVALPRTPGGGDSSLALGAAVVATSLVELVRLPERMYAALAAVSAAAAAALAAGLAPHTTAVFGAALGLCVAVIAVAVRRLLLAQPAITHPRSALTMAAAPLAAGGMLAYVLTRIFVG